MPYEDAKPEASATQISISGIAATLLGLFQWVQPMSPLLHTVIWAVIVALALRIVWLARARFSRRVVGGLYVSVVCIGVALAWNGWVGEKSPTIQGQNVISQIGNNNQATINNVPAPWVMSADQKALVAAVVRKHVGLWDGKSDVIMAAVGNPESERMAVSFVEAFRAGGWNLPYGGFARGIYRGAPLGMELLVPAGGHSDAAVMAFAEDLGQALIEGRVIEDRFIVTAETTFVEGRFQLRLGHRPDAKDATR